jgi:hypothetical protein
VSIVAVVLEAYVNGMSATKVDGSVEQLGRGAVGAGSAMWAALIDDELCALALRLVSGRFAAARDAQTPVAGMQACE